MPRAATGTVRPLKNGRFEARLRVDDKGTRRGFTLTAIRAHDAVAANERATAMAEAAQRLRLAAHPPSRIIELMKIGARARAGRPWDSWLVAIDRACSCVLEPLSERAQMTVRQLGEEWRSGELHRRHPDHVREKEHGRDEEIARIYVDPVLGSMRVAEVTLDDCDDVMAQLEDRAELAARSRRAALIEKAKAEGRKFKGKKASERTPIKLAAASRRHVAQYLRRLLHLAVYPARLREANPVPRGWLPRVKSAKAKEFLYPAEDRTLLACKLIPIARRLRWGILDREGMRAGELARLTWMDVDLERGRVDLDENKTDDPRAWDLDAGVLRALQLWKKHFHPDAARDALILPADKGSAFRTDTSAAMLRADLRRAGITREKLFERSSSRQPMRAHDLRATFITVSLANGRTETWVQDRTGHKSSAMINVYRRNARTWSGLSLGELAPLDETIPELAELRDSARRAAAGPGPARARAGSSRAAERVMNSPSRRKTSQDVGAAIAVAAEIADRARIAASHAPGDRPQNPPPKRREGSSPSFGTESKNAGDPHADARTADSTGQLTDPFVSQTGGDLIEGDLARALTDASAAGRWDVAALLAKELEARRLARAGNVVPLGRVRRRT